MATLDDTTVRQAAFNYVRGCLDENGLITAAQLRAGFPVAGERLKLVNLPRGIAAPKGQDIALTFLTTPPKSGGVAPYDDAFDFQLGLLTYRYEGRNPGALNNVRLRRAYETGVPLIYLYGVSPGCYAPSIAMIVGDAPEALSVTATLTSFDNPSRWQHIEGQYPQIEAGYRSSQRWERLHQAQFRHRVLAAYEQRCALCRLNQRPLLDAAHIIPDSEQGQPTVTNGLAMCNLHHRAYDRDIIGIAPDLKVAVRRDVRTAKDGPMLEHGLQGFHGARIWTPRSKNDKPNPDFLETRYEAFKQAN